MIATAYSLKCLSFNEIVKKLYVKLLLKYYFPHELRHQNTAMSEYLCFNNLKDTTCCRCETTCKDYGYCCHDTFYNNNITSVDEYIDLMFKEK